MDVCRGVTNAVVQRLERRRCKLAAERTTSGDLPPERIHSARCAHILQLQSHTPLCPEQHPCLFEQLKHVGERVPSQHFRPWFGGSEMKIDSARVTVPQSPFALNVTVSVPFELAV